VYTELGTTKTDYLSVGGHTVVELKKVGTTTTPTYLHPDLLGSPRKATNQAKALLWSEHYDPYGLKLNGVAQKIGYTGHAHDAESGYTYMQARFYDPLVGRFLSTDPIHFVDDNPFTFNRYSYANNNPYRYTDPNGELVVLAIPVAVWVGNLATGYCRCYFGICGFQGFC
jgi:RHS repeat-associated protein